MTTPTGIRLLYLSAKSRKDRWKRLCFNKASRGSSNLILLAGGISSPLCGTPNACPMLGSFQWFKRPLFRMGLSAIYAHSGRATGIQNRHITNKSPYRQQNKSQLISSINMTFYWNLDWWSIHHVSSWTYNLPQCTQKAQPRRQHA